MGVFVQIDSIGGDSKHAKHKGWIVADGCTIPTTRPETQTTMGKVTDRTRSNLEFEDVTLKKAMDMASPGLMTWNLKGDGRKVVIHFTDEIDWFLELTLHNTILTKLEIDADREGTATESLSLDFTKIEYRYRTKKENGKEYEAPKSMTYDLALGKVE
jgi:type VI protein secretion system component Hcp